MEKSISKFKDTDREILLKMSDKDFLKTCNVNNYFRTKVCDDTFLQRRLRETYPDTLIYKKDESWRQYFLDVVYYIAKLKEVFNYVYKNGNPKLQYYILKVTEGNKNKLDPPTVDSGVLFGAVQTGDVNILKYLVEEGGNMADLHSDDNLFLKYASRLGYLDIVRYLVEHGGNIHAQNDFALRIARKKNKRDVVNYLESLP